MNDKNIVPYRTTSQIDVYDLRSTPLEQCQQKLEAAHVKKYNQFISAILRASSQGKTLVSIGLSHDDAIDCGFTTYHSGGWRAPHRDDFNPKNLLWLKMLVDAGFSVSFRTEDRFCNVCRIVIEFKSK